VWDARRLEGEEESYEDEAKKKIPILIDLSASVLFCVCVFKALAQTRRRVFASQFLACFAAIAGEKG
jgi:hypothetical protein